MVPRRAVSCRADAEAVQEGETSVHPLLGGGDHEGNSVGYHQIPKVWGWFQVRLLQV